MSTKFTRLLTVADKKKIKYYPTISHYLAAQPKLNLIICH